MWKRLNRVGGEERTLELMLRIGVAGCYIGHGAFGVMGKEAWLPYFAVAGIGPDLAWTLMPVVGSFDILIGILALVTPRPAVLVYAAGWGVWTALLRPLSGESVFETLERAGNYGVPVAFLIFAGVAWRPTLRWIREVDVSPLTPDRRRRVMTALRITVATLLVGHGGLALLGKPLLADHLAAVGLPGGSLALVGAFEMALAAAVLLKPVPGLLLGIVAWKVVTEALYPFTGAPFWEFVERAGSYIAPLALWVMVRETARIRTPADTSSPGTAGVTTGTADGAARTATATRMVAAIGVGTALAWSALAGASASAADVGPSAEGAMESSGAALTAGSGPTEASAAGHAALSVPIRSGWTAVSPSAAEGLQELSLLAILRRGGLVLACRHAITDRSRGDARRVDFDDPSTQRVLSADGRAQARRLGEIIRRQGVPVGEVHTSPYARTAESAELTFGRAEVHTALYGRSREKTARLRELLTTVPARGTNRALMTHQGVLYRVLPGVERGSIREGDCMVLDPDGRSFEILARLGPEEWAGLRLEEPEPSDASHEAAGSGPGAADDRRAVTAARRGGTVIVCRHAITGSFREREPVDYADTTTQRLLNRAGERQSRRLGEALRALGVEVTELVASPMSRARRTAELMFDREPTIDGAWHTNGGSYGGPARDARRRTLSEPVESGNRLIVSHIGTMSSVLDGIQRRVGEGDCVVVRPLGDGYDIIGVVEAEAWTR